MCGAAEVYIRSKGLVSTYLCNQTLGCRVRTAVKPASHFRLALNSISEETSIFVAQGGALGIFVAWLEAQKRLIGKYILIVGSRKFRQLGFKDELLRLANSLKACLQIVVILSKPEEHDHFLLRSAGVEGFNGRVTHYLDQHCFDKIRNVYICGTPSFGLDVAKCKALHQENINYPKRLEPVITSHLPPIRLHVAPEAHVVQELPKISPGELSRHNLPNDLWVAVGESVYDITALSKFHPGGEKILMARAGRQAEDIFTSVHGDAVDILSMMQDMIVGQLIPSQLEQAIWTAKLDKVIKIQNDLTNHSRFEQLPDEARDLSQVPPTYVIYASIECFSRDWCSVLQEVGSLGLEQCHLMRAWIGLRSTLDARQAKVYEDSFDDDTRCRQVMQQVFNCLRTLSGHIHTALDRVKSQIAACVSEDCVLDSGIFEACTESVIAAIYDQTQQIET